MFHDFLTELEMVTLKQMTLAELEVHYLIFYIVWRIKLMWSF